jgi:hypothetical protein
VGSLRKTDRGAVRADFHLLIEELLTGTTQRCKFETWEIDILLDALNCDLGPPSKADAVLRQYRKAGQMQIEAGAPVPMKLSEFLALRREASRTASAAGMRRRRKVSDGRDTGRKSARAGE